MNQPSWYVTVLWWLWYVTVLWWLWFAFPFVKPLVLRWCGRWPWLHILFINGMGMALVTPMLNEGYWAYATIPAFRFSEFLIGCVAATTVGRRVHWVWPAGAAVLMLALHLDVFYMVQRTPLCDAGGYDTWCIDCQHPWSFLWTNPFTNRCLLVWSYAYMNKFAMFYAVIIH
jgi:hypothetical protein